MIVETNLSSPTWTSFDPSPFFASDKSLESPFASLESSRSTTPTSAPGTPHKSIGTATTASISPSTSSYRDFSFGDEREEDDNDSSSAQQHETDLAHHEDPLTQQVLNLEHMFEAQDHQATLTRDVDGTTDQAASTPAGKSLSPEDTPATHQRNNSQSSAWSWLERKYHANQQANAQEETVLFVDEGNDNTSLPPQLVLEDEEPPKITARVQNKQFDIKINIEEDEDPDDVLEGFRDLACTSMDKAFGFWDEIQKIFYQSIEPKDAPDIISTPAMVHSPKASTSIPATIQTTSPAPSPEIRDQRMTPPKSPGNGLRRERSVSETLSDYDFRSRSTDDLSSITEPPFVLPDEFMLGLPIVYPKARPSRGTRSSSQGSMQSGQQQEQETGVDPLKDEMDHEDDNDDNTTDDETSVEFITDDESSKLQIGGCRSPFRLIHEMELAQEDSFSC